MSSSPSPPPTPDYAGAAAVTAAGNAEQSRIAAAANRVNQYSPNGSITYQQPKDYANNPNTLAPWSVTESLSPGQQKLYDQNQQINQGLGDVANRGVGYVQTALDTPLSMNGVNSISDPGKFDQQASDAAYSNATRYLDPQMAQQRESMDANLANQGLTPGSEAYNNAHQQFDANSSQQYGQARNQAYLQGLQGGNQAYNQNMGAHNQQLADKQVLQQNPINMLNSVRSGQQMQVAQMPNQMSVPQQQTVAGPDMLGAANATNNYNMGIYNAKTASNSGALSGGLGMLGTIGSGVALALSDRRIKRDITRIGTHIKGIGLYIWTYIWGEVWTGCMADEVEAIMPEAVSLHSSGFKMVNYGVLNG